MKKVMFFLLVVSIMASCSHPEGSGNRETYKLAKVKLPNGDLDWVRLNTVEAKVFNVGDGIKVSRKLHRISSDTTSEKVVIVSFIN